MCLTEGNYDRKGFGNNYSLTPETIQPCEQASSQTFVLNICTFRCGQK